MKDQNDIKHNRDDKVLLPLPIILSANAGEPEAMNIVLSHYEKYITYLSVRRFRKRDGYTYYGVDEDVRIRLQSRLIEAVLKFKI
ncbi:MAG: helix-turn-helix domain-containing protein [Ruminococcaceae bacterium]|nr:helix-turn-helix domain-containing protein [Oscillospiraceae bacterium]